MARLGVGEARAIAHAPKCASYSLRRSFMWSDAMSGDSRLVLQLVHRHVLELVLAFERLVTARADDALEL